MDKQPKQQNAKKRGTLSWVFEFAGNKKLSYIISVILAIISVICGFMPYVYLAKILKSLIEGTAELDYCVTQILWMGLFFAGDRVMHTISTALSHRATFAVLANIRHRLTAKLARMPLGDVLDKSSGSYKNIIVERVDATETTLAHMIPEVTSNFIIPFVIFGYMLSINTGLAFASLISVPVGLVAFVVMLVGNGPKFQKTIEKTKALNDTAVEYINGIEVIKAFGKAKTSYEKFVVAAREGADCFIDWMRSCNVSQNLAITVMPATLVGLLAFGIPSYMNGSVSGSDFVMLIVLALGLVGPFLTATGYLDDISKMKAIFGEVTDILTARELERPDMLKVQPKDSSVVLKDVHFAYKDEEVLHGVNLDIKAGTVNALVGASGSGKSTIAKLIASFWDVGSGSITYGGVDIRELPMEYYQKQVAYVSQDNYLFDESVMENIRMGNPSATDDEVILAAKACGIHEFIMGLDKGYDTICGGAGSHLSGGERQRISIARAMLKNAPLIILDEATAYTDPENEALVQKSVAKLVQGRTLIVIAHRLATIASADKIILIDNGQVSASGTQEELLAKSPLYASMWNAHTALKEEGEDNV